MFPSLVLNGLRGVGVVTVAVDDVTDDEWKDFVTSISI